MRQIFLILCIAFLASCEKKEASIVLTGGSYRYWQVKNCLSSMRKDYTCYYFDKNDRLIMFFYKSKEKMHEYNSDDELYTPKWNLKDSILVIANYESHILELKYNRILIKYKRSGYTDTLKAIPYVRIPMRYRHYYNGPTRYIPEAIR